MGTLIIAETPLPDLKVVNLLPHHDDRGAFTRMFCASELQPVLGDRRIAQINLSKTLHAGTVRGFHFQRPPHAEMKMISCIRGRVWDVVVDIRAGSSTFLHWHALELHADDAQMIVVPEGFAHGFQALERDSELLYLHTEFYNPLSEGGLRYDDPRLAVTWPAPPHGLSSRDLAHPLLDSDFTGI